MDTWTLEDGLRLVRALQPESRQFGYHVALGGGVLNKGASDKDIDLYFMPLDNGRVKCDIDRLYNWLSGMWGPGEEIPRYEEPVAPPNEGEFVPPPAEGLQLGDPEVVQEPMNQWRARAEAPARRIGRLEPDGPALRPWREAVRGGARVAEPPPRRINWEQIAAQGGGGVFVQAGNAPPPLPPQGAVAEVRQVVVSPYKMKLKFIRPPQDRIDVFIL